MLSDRSPQRHAGTLDPLSKAAVVSFCLRLGVPVALVLSATLTGAWPFDKSVETLGLWLSASSWVSVAVAVWRGETFNAGSLNRWDESLMFLALARLAHMAQVHPG